jgi:hypothetical protein
LERAGSQGLDCFSSDDNYDDYDEKERNRTDQRRKRQILDVGFGCGDQTLYLTGRDHHTDNMNNKGPENSKEARSSTRQRPRERRPLFDSYIGLTNNHQQAKYAEARLTATATTATTATGTATTTGTGTTMSSTCQEENKIPENLPQRGTCTPIQQIHLFCEDAANPSSWNPEIHNLLAGQPKEDEDDEIKTETYLLALDTLYHFTPSREPLFQYSYTTLNASIMAFDLFMSDCASLSQRLLLRFVCMISATPYSNFMTMAQYKDLLVRVGYQIENIEIVDVSGDVLPGISTYIVQREKEMKKVGMSLGKFTVAGRLFGWWARSRVVRAGIVVARR